mmetsp:Transcript_76802/g.176208  ORF Transcript_76802/g.176208 Transcript_76802/m.176208 type:complete len:186 (+) Transcript_76802:1144-1701(+)
MSAAALKMAGFSLSELRNAGFAAQTLRVVSKQLSAKSLDESLEDSGAADHVVSRPPTSCGLLDDDLEDDPYRASNRDLQRWWATPRVRDMYRPPRPGAAVAAKKKLPRIQLPDVEGLVCRLLKEFPGFGGGVDGRGVLASLMESFDIPDSAKDQISQAASAESLAVVLRSFAVPVENGAVNDHQQ